MRHLGALGPGGTGNDAQGGGAFLDVNSTLNLYSTYVVGNVAAGGLLGIGHPNGTFGTGSGGGVYFVGATLNEFGFTLIAGNGPNNTIGP